ncbi:hypothetical protein [Pseudaquabacterium terrae]|uniref:hypothetical protein n=1 Tax=Pseudaquabacterium terrae TaxID=2732868 RepID=UPI0031B5AB4B
MPPRMSTGSAATGAGVATGAGFGDEIAAGGGVATGVAFGAVTGASSGAGGSIVKIGAGGGAFFLKKLNMKIRGCGRLAAASKLTAIIAGSWRFSSVG